jgi:hypothetical protein
MGRRLDRPSDRAGDELRRARHRVYDREGHLLPVLGGRRFSPSPGASWSGPGAVGATLAHWLVAAVTIVLAYVAIIVLERIGGGLTETRGRR